MQSKHDVLHFNTDIMQFSIDILKEQYALTACCYTIMLSFMELCFSLCYSVYCYVRHGENKHVMFPSAFLWNWQAVRFYRVKSPGTRVVSLSLNVLFHKQISQFSLV